MSTMEIHAAQTQAIRLIIPTLMGTPAKYNCRPIKGKSTRAVNFHLEGSTNHTNNHMTTTITTRIDADSSTTEASSSSSPKARSCAGTCGQLIPTKRLAVRPNATMCVPCLEAAGDVPQTLRMDEFDADGFRQETYFRTDSPAMECFTQHMHRMNTVVPGERFYEIAVGDDSFLVREGDSVIDTARHPSTAFEEGDDEVKTTYSLPMAA